jgi:acetolactate synthase-1/3 small subunit
MTHTLSVLVENKPGALARISNMFARRGFNIESLAVGPTERPEISRITLCVDCDERSLEQIQKQMHKLVNVLRITELTPGQSIEREFALIKVSAPPSRRSELIGLAEVFLARIADLGPDAIVFELAGTPEEIDSFEELVRPHGVKELVRTGRIGLGRASTTPTTTTRSQLVLR